MTDIVERLRDWMTIDQTTSPASRMAEAAYEIQSLRQQLAECQAREKVLRNALQGLCNLVFHPSVEADESLTEIVAAKAALAMPSDSTALDELKRQWQREALLEAAEYCDNQWRWSEAEYQQYEQDVGDGIRRMAKELE